MMRMRWPAWDGVTGLGLRAGVLAVLLLAGRPAPADAQGLQVAPVGLELHAGESVTTVLVSNHSNQVAGMQVRSFAWSQQGGQDRLSPTQALDVSPPIFEVPAGGSQLVRLVLRSAPADAEAAYRLLFDQLPTATGTGVTLALRFSIPLFAEPPNAVAADLDLHVEREGAGAVLVARNRGTRRDRLFAPSLLAAGARLGLASNTNYYILAGSEQRWAITGRVSALQPGARVQLTATSLTGRLNTAVAVLGP